MNILFFANGSYISGMEIVTLTLMKELREQGHEPVAVVSGWNDGLYLKKLTESGIRNEAIKIGRVYLTKPLWSVGSLLHFPHAACRLRGLIKEFNPDIVVIGGVEIAATAMHALPKNLPIILHLHEKPSKHYSTWLGRYVLSRVRGIITVSDFINDLVKTTCAHGSLVRTVHNGVPSRPPRTHFHRDRIRIGIIGQIAPEKRHLLLVNAIKLLAEMNKDMFEICIYGDDRTDYARKVALEINNAGLDSYFQWMGFVALQSEIYADLDLVVALAIDEPFGTTVLEAGAEGLPVIAARSGGFPEMVIDGETGLLVTPDDPCELARAIITLCDTLERERLGRNAQCHIRENFSSRAMARNFLSAVSSFGCHVHSCL